MSDNQLHIFDDGENKLRPFEPLHGKRVNMYVCGVTVYDRCHIGHARAYVCFDVIRRYLEYRGYDVYYIQNFTDVDDKIINKANSENTSVDVIAERYITEYFRDMDALGVRRANIYPRATGYIQDMAAIIQTLVDRGYAYAVDGNVFFEVGKFAGYGKLSGRGADEASIQEPAPGKRAAADFALWKASSRDEPGWQSPWGVGRPGWHTECSAMALKLAGGTLDIHGGGEDLSFPHHENEIAQSEAATGEPFARYWMHNGFIQIDKEKMSKSLGNVMNVRDILSRHSPEALRLLFLSAHYKAQIHFSMDRVEDAERGLDRFRGLWDAVSRLSNRAAADAEATEKTAAAVDELYKFIADTQQAFEAAMNEDFNTPVALAQVFNLVRRANAAVAVFEAEQPGGMPGAVNSALAAAAVKITELCAVLGLDVNKITAARAAQSDDIDKLLELLILLRNKAREQKNYEYADLIRNGLSEGGFVLEDRNEGTTWKRK